MDREKSKRDNFISILLSSKEILSPLIMVLIALEAQFLLFIAFFREEVNQLEFGTGILASLFAAAIAAGIGYVFRGLQFKKAVFNAPKRYVDHLDNLINGAVDGGFNNVEINGRALVSTRDDLRKSLVSLADLLNSDIDLLSSQIEKGYKHHLIYETVQVLSKKWPSKKDQIQVEIRKVIAELGLEKY